MRELVIYKGLLAIGVKTANITIVFLFEGIVFFWNDINTIYKIIKNIELNKKLTQMCLLVPDQWL